MLVLSVEAEEARAQRPQVGGRGASALNERAGPP